MRFRRAVGLFLSLGWVLACGGRFEQTIAGDDQPEGGTTSAAGTTSMSGGRSTGKAGSNSRAGSPSVGGTTAAAGNVGTGASGGACLCIDLDCAPPFRSVSDSGCCSHCELDLMACATIGRDYEIYRDQVLQKYQTSGCLSDSDCTLLFDGSCRTVSCGVPLLSSQLDAVTQMLESYAQANCSDACPPPPPCGFMRVPRCVMNRCQ